MSADSVSGMIQKLIRKKKLTQSRQSDSLFWSKVAFSQFLRLHLKA